MYNGIALKSYLAERLDKLRSSYVGALKNENNLKAIKCLGAIEELQLLSERVRSKKVVK